VTDNRRWVNRDLRWSAFGPAFLRSGLLLAALISVGAYPVFFIYFRNMKEAVFTQVFGPLLVFAAVALAAWLVFGILSGTMAKGAFTALLFLLVFMNYALIESGLRKIVPDWRWWRIAPAFLFLLVSLALALRAFVTRREGDDNLFKMTAGIGSVCLALTLFNAANGLYTLAQAPPAESRMEAAGSPKTEGSLSINSASTRPNFYYFIFDEYARQDVLKKYTGFDDRPFLKRLENKGFKVSYSSESGSDNTRLSVGSLLHFGHKYKPSLETRQDTWRPPLLEVFKKAGYKTYATSPFYRFDAGLLDVPLKSLTVPASLSIEKAVMARSFFAYLNLSENEAVRQDRLNLLEKARGIVLESAKAPKFLFFHILFPHEPFVFDENGDPVAAENMHNWSDPRHYAGQVIFLSKFIDQLTTVIIARDPRAVILLQSDHGARFFAHMTPEERQACLNCVYLGGEDGNIEGLGPVNTLRLALNYALGLKLDLLEE
jgi:Sulfatase